MVTGDNVETARAIAERCGIIKPGDGYLVMEGSEFRKKVTNAKGEVSVQSLEPELCGMSCCHYSVGGSRESGQHLASSACACTLLPLGQAHLGERNHLLSST